MGCFLFLCLCLFFNNHIQDVLRLTNNNNNNKSEKGLHFRHVFIEILFIDEFFPAIFFYLNFDRNKFS